jgi:cytochrome c oxidase subunit II
MASRSHRFPRLLVSLFALTALGGCASEEYPQTTFQPVTGFGRIIDNLFHGVFWWTMLVLLVVFVVLGYVLIRFRERPDSPDPKPVYGNTVLEITWTVIPALIIVAILIPTIRGIFQTQRAAPKDALVVEVIGHQWWWEFKYPSLGITTASQLVLPVGRPLDLRLHSADVIHSFWIPRLGGKRDVNPVRQMPNGEKPPHLNHISLTVDSVGEYPGQCAEFCGTEHGAMRMLAIAVPPSEFDAWVQRMKAGQDSSALSAPQDSLARRGKQKFLSSACIACHAVSGTSAMGQIGPNLTALGDRWSIGAGVLDNTPANVERWIMHAPQIKPGIIMPGAQEGAGGMPPTGLSESDARAVAAYLSSLSAGVAPKKKTGWAIETTVAH